MLSGSIPFPFGVVDEGDVLEFDLEAAHNIVVHCKISLLISEHQHIAEKYTSCAEAMETVQS
jgi:hypothetical protein